ncbi:MAG: hypothetical protein QM484_00060 [Woeseiaceae bacterium]
MGLEENNKNETRKIRLGIHNQLFANSLCIFNATISGSTITTQIKL